MKSRITLLAAMGMVVFGSNAQKLTNDYIKWPDSQGFAQYVKAWTPGTPLFEDENFFISRVKAKPLLSRNTAIQIYDNINDANDKKLLWWVPVGYANLDGVHTDALPNSLFDSEVFSAWNYVTHFGDWISPHGWVPAGLADAAHRNGVAVSGVASIPNASLSGAWLSCISDQGSLDVEKAGNFLLYHGVNGLGYNSEYATTSSVQAGLRNFHIALNKYMADKDPIFEIVAYDGTSDGGGIAFSERLCSTNQNNFGRAGSESQNLFLNYNWNSDSYISESEQYCKELGRNMLDLYAGMNMQGGCKSDTEWLRHQTINYSIGLWGAHNLNYLWNARSQQGSSDIAKQRMYQRLLEWWFTNGNRNPINKIDVYKEKSLSANDHWFGMSHFMSARTSLGWDLAEEPFITNFNLGNGTFFNYKGVRQNDNSWYNIGVQDYLPTWRFWFADKFLGKDKSNVPAAGLDAEFTWDDAYFGGSSLKVFGSTSDEYLHLFRTNYKLDKGDVITVRYKLMSGKANMSLALSVEGKETTIVQEDKFNVMTTEQGADDELWVEKTFTIVGPTATAFNVNPLVMVALHFTNAENLDILLGEFSIKRGSSATPAAPRIETEKVLAYNYRGLDAKVIFNMPNNKPVDQVCYNSDVNTSIFKIYAQQKGQEPMLMGSTRSWAALVYQFPVASDGEKQVRFGVQAVSFDMDSESEISWGDYIPTGDYGSTEGIKINKSTVKPGESFELSFLDPLHAAESWTILDEKGQTKASGNGTSLVVAEGINELGTYSVKVGDITYPNFFMITAWERGALPEILKLTVNGEDASDEAVTIAPATDVLLGYEGRGADGESSRGVEIAEQFVGVKMADLGVGDENGALDQYKSFATAAWVKMNLPSATSSLFQIENRGLGWPQNNWGWCWFNIAADGKLDIRFRGSSLEMGYYYDDLKISNNTWTHVAFSFEYEGSSFRFRLFINGEEVKPYLYGSAAGGGAVPTGSDMKQGADGEYDLWINNRYPVTGTDYLCWGGGRGDNPTYNNGTIDDMVVWLGGITADDAKAAMQGFKADALPENVLAFWSFEDEPVSNCFLSKGQITDAKAINFALEKTGEEGQGIQTPTVLSLSAGCPTIDGSAFSVKTAPAWTAKRGVVSEAAGSDKAGQAKVNYSAAGDYFVTLKLENVLGQDQATYPVLKAAVTDAIEAVDAAAAVAAYSIDNAFIVEFPEAGDYTVAVYDLQGKLVAQRSQNVAAGQSMAVGVHAQGVYMLNILKEGRVIRTVKLLKK